MESRTQKKIPRDRSSHESIDHTLPPPLTSRVQRFPCRRVHRRSAHPHTTQSRTPMSNLESRFLSPATSVHTTLPDDLLPAASSSATTLDQVAAEPLPSQHEVAQMIAMDTQYGPEVDSGQDDDSEAVEVTSLVSPDAETINQEGHSPSDDVTVGPRPPDSMEGLASTSSQSLAPDKDLTVLKDEPLDEVPPQTARSTSTEEPEPDLLSTYTCPICFCPPTNASLVLCGHVFCGSCLFIAVKSTLKRGMEPDGIARYGPHSQTPAESWLIFLPLGVQFVGR